MLPTGPEYGRHTRS